MRWRLANNKNIECMRAKRPAFVWIDERESFCSEWGHCNRLKSNAPWRYSYVEIFVFVLEVRSRFSVSLACWRNMSHIWSGQSLCTVANPATRWYFVLLTAGSSAFARWLWGSTIWMRTLSLQIYFCTAFKHSLSRTWRFGCHPLIFKVS